MTLRYALSSGIQAGPNDRGLAYLTLDSRGVATAVSTTAAPGLVPLRYRWHQGWVVFGAESYFFQEGQGELFGSARYGELRVDEKGTPILVALLDGELRPIEP